MERDESTSRDGAEEDDADRTVGLGALVSLLLAGSVAVTLIGGAPGSLPDAALSSEVLFHAERTGALFLLLLGALALVKAAFAGQLPAEFSPQGVKLAERGIEGVQRRVRSLQRAFRESEGRVEAAEAAARAGERLVAVERARIDALEQKLESPRNGTG